MSQAIVKKLQNIRSAFLEFQDSSVERKNTCLNQIAIRLIQKKDLLLSANKKDLREFSKNMTQAFIDRLTLNEDRIALMAESLRQVATLSDPLGEADLKTLPNGLILRRVRSPLGIILMIFESRPNVAFEAFGLAFKAGNAIILRGGRESTNTTKVIYKLISDVLVENNFPQNLVWGIFDADRKIPQFLLKQKKYIDVVVPRGGEGLINYVVKNSLIPIIKNDRGLCHVFVNSDADLSMAVEIVVNAKVQRPGVCNSMETVLIHHEVAVEFLNLLHPRMAEKKVKWFVDKNTAQILGKKPEMKMASPKNWDTEYLDLMMNCKVVNSYDEALEHIEKHGSRHSESIVTASEKFARRFQSEVDAAAVYWNASTRFTDGFEFGLGGELGISTQKLHVRGPIGLRELTSFRWIIDGTGQIRE
jgi:glutamate-5-semialdehyde dehydrogenase